MSQRKIAGPAMFRLFLSACHQFRVVPDASTSVRPSSNSAATHITDLIGALRGQLNAGMSGFPALLADRDLSSEMSPRWRASGGRRLQPTERHECGASGPVSGGKPAALQMAPACRVRARHHLKNHS
jgi:hypothetical protein